MKSLSDLRELLLGIRERADRQFRAPCYEKLCAFLGGMELALICPVMDGFRERITAAGGPPNPGWGCGFPHTVFRTDPDPLRTVLTDTEADVRATTALLDLIMGFKQQ